MPKQWQGRLLRTMVHGLMIERLSVELCSQVELATAYLGSAELCHLWESHRMIIWHSHCHPFFPFRPPFAMRLKAPLPGVSL